MIDLTDNQLADLTDNQLADLTDNQLAGLICYVSHKNTTYSIWEQRRFIKLCLQYTASRELTNEQNDLLDSVWDEYNK